MTKVTGTVRIVGAGLLGTSLGLALRNLGIDVVLSSRSAKSVDLAISYGAGRLPAANDTPQIVVVCVPPDLTAQIVAEELTSFPAAVVTDVASVKGQILTELQSMGIELSNYVGSHPMAGRERGGAIAGRADLFVGRPWVITSHENISKTAVDLVTDLAVEVGAAVIKVDTLAHDRAVALVSHVPQVIASLLASRLVAADDADVALAGQGLRDTTRIAASDADLWVQILNANSTAVLDVLKPFEADLKQLIAAIESGAPTDAFADVLAAGNAGVARIPGKHGGKHAEYSKVIVMVEDRPGELARLLTEVGQIGVNLEELQLEHSPSAQIGLAELYVSPSEADRLTESLAARGWRIG